MTEQKIIGSVMTTYPYYIDSHSSLGDAKQMFDQYGVNHLPVKDESKLIGIVTRKGMDKALATEVSAQADVEAQVADICNREILIVDRDEALKEVLEEMAKLHLECVLITGENGLEGIYTFTDVCRGYARLLE